MSDQTKTEFVAGLDIGSGRVTCLVGSVDEATSAVEVLGGASVICRSVAAGVVVNSLETAAAIKRVVGEASAAAKLTVSSVRIGVRGNHLQSFNNKGTHKISRADRTITADDVSAVVAVAAAIPLSSDREILHVVPRGFLLDRRRSVSNPVGMDAELLEVDAHLVTVSAAHLKNIMKTVSRAGFEKLVPVYCLLAAGELLVTREEKERGCILIDIGGQSTSLGFYCEGAIRYAKEISFGSDLITRDLAIGLKTSFATAEKIKIDHGIAHPSLMNGDDDIQCRGDDGQMLLRVKKTMLMDIIGPRVEEIFSIAGEDLRNSGYFDMIIPGGAVLTGGGSLMRGMADAAQKWVGMSVHQGAPPSNLVQADEQWLSPIYSTALGLLHYSSPPRRGGINTAVEGR
jgi:cell division protein FtsA